MKAQSSKVAIVGMSGRFPGAGDVAAFWDALVTGRELIEHFTETELLASGVDRRVLQDAHYVRARPIIGDVSQFDAAFFRMSAREAEVTDPQLRLLLECAWEALEESGHAPPGYGGTVGVYAGLRLSRYLDEHLLANPSLVRALGRDYLMMINRKDSASTWLAYRLNLTGPAISVNTACSTSLVAVHLAATALLNFECDVALAGGAALPCFTKEGYIAPPNSPWSPDGHCRAFDEQASGTLEGVGCAVVALKRLEDALADGDIIHAVVLGSTVNNDGSNKIGYTAPGLDGQARVISEAMAVANVTGDDIGYVETHGTATPLGDPIEIAALTAAYRQTTSRVGYCPIGSVKTNIGHVGAAAGVAGLIKVALSLKHNQIPPSLHYRVPNPAIDFQHSPFYVNTTLRSWPSGSDPRRAAVSSFGIGGTNAHVVLEEPPSPPDEIYSPRRFFFLPFSARSHAANAAGLRRLAEHLEKNPGLPLSCVSATLRTARTTFARRRAIVAGDSATAIAGLRRAAETLVESHTDDSPPPIAFRFANRGNRRPGTMRHLYACEPAFRDAFDHCNELLLTTRNLNLRSALSTAEHDDPAEMISEQGEIAELAAFVTQWALAEQFDRFGVRAAALCGYGLGELVAANRAGVFDLPCVLELVASRWRFGQNGSADELQATLTRIGLAEPTIPFISSVTGTWIEPAQATDPAYWLQQTGAARCSEGLNEIAKGTYVVVDFGSLTRLDERSCDRPGLLAIDGCGHTNSVVAEDEAVLKALAQLWELGVQLDWRAFSRGEKTRRVNLPTYPFERHSYWLEPPRGDSSSAHVPTESWDVDLSEVDRLATRTHSLTVKPEAQAEQDLTAWSAVIVDGVAVNGALADAERVAAQENRPLVLILPSAPQTIIKGFLMLAPPRDEPPNVEQLRALVEAAFKSGYRRLLLIDPEGQVPINFPPASTRFAGAVREDLQGRISRIWEATLGVEHILPDDNFFDLGGDSLVAIQMVGQLNEELGVDIRPVELVSLPTIALLAERIEQVILAGVDEAQLESMLADLDSMRADDMREEKEAET